MVPAVGDPANLVIGSNPSGDAVRDAPGNMVPWLKVAASGCGSGESVPPNGAPMPPGAWPGQGAAPEQHGAATACTAGTAMVGVDTDPKGGGRKHAAVGTRAAAHGKWDICGVRMNGCPHGTASGPLRKGDWEECAAGAK